DSGAALRAALRATVPDVVFLDIRLPTADGITLARELREQRPQPLVVFITAFATHAVAAFEVQAVDYLLKPFDDQRFEAALRRLEQVLGDPASRGRRRLVIRSIGRVQFVDIAQIDWLAASGNYVEIHA